MKSVIRNITCIVAMATLGACATQDKTSADLTLHVFDCGEIEVRDVSLFSPGVDKGQKKQMVDSCYLIQHPKGTLLWDAGLNDAIGPEGIEVWEGAFFMRVANPLLSQLQAIDIDPAQVDYIGISHFHSDHTGNANLFSAASLLIQQAEYDAAFGDKAKDFGFEPDSYSQLDRTKIKVLSGDYDVFGDGRVVIKTAPGHTPGHQMLFVDLAETGPVVLSGDLYHFTKNRQHRRVPSFNYDKPQTLEAMDAIEAFVKARGAQLWIQHDKEQNATIKHSPALYR